MCEAVNTISDVAQGRHSSGMSSYEGNGELAAALDDFDDQVQAGCHFTRERGTRFPDWLQISQTFLKKIRNFQ